MKWVVPTADMKIAQRPDRLVADTLGSCLCLTVYDPASGVGALWHAMLPLSKINLKKARINPFMFVDTGIPALFSQLVAQENIMPRDHWAIKAVGCGNPMGSKEIFKIGERNYRTLCKWLTNENLSLTAEDIGGTASRSVRLDLASGKTIVYRNGAEKVL